MGNHVTSIVTILKINPPERHLSTALLAHIATLQGGPASRYLNSPSSIVTGPVHLPALCSAYASPAECRWSRLDSLKQYRLKT